MSNIKQFPAKNKSGLSPSVPHDPKAEVVNIEQKINEAIECRLGNFVKEIQALKTKQKKIEAYQKACSKLKSDKKHKKKKAKKPAKKPKK